MLWESDVDLVIHHEIWGQRILWLLLEGRRGFGQGGYNLYTLLIAWLLWHNLIALAAHLAMLPPFANRPTS